MRYYGEIKDEYSIVNKGYVDKYIQKLLANVSNIYIKATYEEINEIENPSYGDFCLIISFETGKKSLYCYIPLDLNEDEISNLQWVWISDLGKTLNSLIELEDGNWDYFDGDTAKLVLTSDTTLNITNVNEGDYGIIDIFGSYELTLPSNSYSFPPDWNYLIPNSNQHYRYSFYYDGNKFDWSRSVRENE